MYGSKYSKLKKAIEVYLVRLTKVCGKVLSEKYAYKYVKTALLLSNVIDPDHQNSHLFTNKKHFSLPSWVLIGVLANFMRNTLPIALTLGSRNIFQPLIQFKLFFQKLLELMILQIPYGDFYIIFL